LTLVPRSRETTPSFDGTISFPRRRPVMDHDRIRRGILALLGAMLLISAPARAASLLAMWRIVLALALSTVSIVVVSRPSWLGEGDSDSVLGTIVLSLVYLLFSFPGRFIPLRGGLTLAAIATAWFALGWAIGGVIDRRRSGL